jgi:hypothetical protein
MSVVFTKENAIFRKFGTGSNHLIAVMDGQCYEKSTRTWEIQTQSLHNKAPVCIGILMVHLTPGT